MQPQNGIRTFINKLFKRSHHQREHLSRLLDEHISTGIGIGQFPVILQAVIIGILAAYGAILFRYLIQSAHLLFFGTQDYSLAILKDLSWWRRLLLPASGAFIVGVIVTRFSPEVKGSGIPEVMESVALKGGIIRLRVLLTKALAAAFTIGAGGSAGREGPIVHIGAAIGSAVGQFNRLPPRHLRTFVACGAASAIAATFNAPIAGALFALEVIVGEMKAISMPPIVIASVIATVISRHHLGDFPAFNVPNYNMVSSLELVLYAILGVLAGGIGAFFIFMFKQFDQMFDRIKFSGIFKTALGGLGVGLIALLVPHVFGVGYETINSALWNKIDAEILILALFAKILATCLSLGSGGSGGIFAPSLFIGATLGAFFGQSANVLFGGWTAGPGAYALVGMGAVVAAVTHAPISAILIIFELTNNYLIIPPLMLACIISILISRKFSKISIYLLKLKSRGVNIFSKRDVNLLRSINVKQVMEYGPFLIPSSTPFSTMLSKLLTGKRPFAFVVGLRNEYIGTVELNDLRQILPESDILSNLVIAGDVANTAVPFVLPNDNLDLVMHLFGKTNKDEIAVCESIEKKWVIGSVTQAAVINAYNTRIFQEDLPGSFGSLMDTVDSGRSVEILDGMHLYKMEVPYAWVGKTMKEVDLRRKYQLEVVVVHRENNAEMGSGTRPGMFPSPDLHLAEGDQLLVLGTPKTIKRIRKNS